METATILFESIPTNHVRVPLPSFKSRLTMLMSLPGFAGTKPEEGLVGKSPAVVLYPANKCTFVYEATLLKALLLA